MNGKIDKINIQISELETERDKLKELVRNNAVTVNNDYRQICIDEDSTEFHIGIYNYLVTSTSKSSREIELLEKYSEMFSYSKDMPKHIERAIGVHRDGMFGWSNDYDSDDLTFSVISVKPHSEFNEISPQKMLKSSKIFGRIFAIGNGQREKE